MQKPPDFAGIGGQAGKILRKKGLFSIAEGLGGICVDFHHKTTGAGGYSGPAQRRNPTGDPGGMAGIHQHRQVGKTLHHRNGGQIQGGAGAALVAADAPFTENDMGISLPQDVLGRGKPFFVGGGQPAF